MGEEGSKNLEKCYVYNIFIIFLQQILVGRLLQIFNLNLSLKLLSCLLVIAHKNLPSKICNENVVKKGGGPKKIKTEEICTSIQVARCIIFGCQMLAI